jgi:hypothetical protein
VPKFYSAPGGLGLDLETRGQIYIGIFSIQFGRLTKRIISPGLAWANLLLQRLGASTPELKISAAE